MHHDADAIVYGTGFAVRAGLPDDTLVGARGVSIQQAWTDGAEPYLGVAVHGFPNYFTVSGPDFAAAMRYVVECLQLMGRHTRIEVRRSAQQVFNERRPPASPFAAPGSLGVRPLVVRRAHDDDLRRSGDPDESPIPRNRCGSLLTGHIEPIDGQYHWQGTVFDALTAGAGARPRTVTLTVGERSAPARITEQTPQGTHSIAGVGAPPYRLARSPVQLANAPQDCAGWPLGYPPDVGIAMATDDGELNVVAIGASAGGVEALTRPCVGRRSNCHIAWTEQPMNSPASSLAVSDALTGRAAASSPSTVCSTAARTCGCAARIVGGRA